MQIGRFTPYEQLAPSALHPVQEAVPPQGAAPRRPSGTEEDGTIVGTIPPAPTEEARAMVDKAAERVEELVASNRQLHFKRDDVRSVDTGEVVRFVDVDANTSYAWTIPSLPVGRYLLFAGTDLDSDGAYDDDGEYVGAWPTLDQPQMVQISAGHTFSGLRLTVSPRTSIDSTASKRR